MISFWTIKFYFWILNRLYLFIGGFYSIYDFGLLIVVILIIRRRGIIFDPTTIPVQVLLIPYHNNNTVHATTDTDTDKDTVPYVHVPNTDTNTMLEFVKREISRVNASHWRSTIFGEFLGI